MSENIRVSEVSDILRKQLEGINANVQLDEIGTVLQVSDGVVRILIYAQVPLLLLANTPLSSL